MLQKFALSLIITCITTLCFAQDKSLLWEISGNGLSKPSYLYGTIHLICPADFTITDPIKNAFSSTEQVYLELDMDDPQMMANMQKIMVNTSGKSLKELLKPDDYTLLNDYYKSKLGIGLEQLNRMKPLALLSMQYMTLLNCQPQSYDLTFAQMAGKEKKEVLGLESIDDQMSAFDKIPAEKQVEQLVEMVRKKDEAVKEFNQMITFYKAQDLEGLQKLMDTSQFSEIDGFEELLLVNRNAAWIPTIETAIKAKPTFIAVGAAHLAGDKGVISLLRKKGYTVKAMR